MLWLSIASLDSLKRGSAAVMSGNFEVASVYLCIDCAHKQITCTVC
jgi:hypothetical protein